MNETAEAAAPPAAPQLPDFSTDTDAELFEWMGEARTDESVAHAAFAEFYRRHAPYLYAQCQRRYGDESGDILQETFRRVYESAGQFDASRLRGNDDPDAPRRLVRAWVGQIVRWVAADHFADRLRGPRLVTPDRISRLPDSRGADPADDLVESDSTVVQEVRRVIESLSEREQAVAWVIAHRWSPGDGTIRWSAEELDTIGERFSLTRENIRQIRVRLIKKLRTLLAPLLSGSHSDR